MTGMGVQSFEFCPGSGHSAVIHPRTSCPGDTETINVSSRGRRSIAAAGTPPAPQGHKSWAGSDFFLHRSLSLPKLAKEPWASTANGLKQNCLSINDPSSLDLWNTDGSRPGWMSFPISLGNIQRWIYRYIHLGRYRLLLAASEVPLSLF